MEQSWSTARCHYMVYFTAMYCDRDAPPQEQMAFDALVRRAPYIRELSDEALDDFRQRALWASEGGLLESDFNKALAGLNADAATGLSIYANCADIIRADRIIRGREQRFMDKLAKSLGLQKKQRALIDKIMDAKNRH